MTREIVLNDALERANKYDLLEEVKTELIHGSTHGKHYMNGIYFMMKNIISNIKILLISITIFLIVASCNGSSTSTEIKRNMYETVVKIYYSNTRVGEYHFYTNNYTYVCSFNGTNYLVESGNKEELFSTTAPMEINNQYKYDDNGNCTEYKTNYSRY